MLVAELMDLLREMPETARVVVEGHGDDVCKVHYYGQGEVRVVLDSYEALYPAPVTPAPPRTPQRRSPKSPAIRRLDALGIPPGKAARLIEAFGSVQRVLAADYDTLIRVPKIGWNTAEQVLKIREQLAPGGEGERQAIDLLQQNRLNPNAIARLTGLTYATVRKLAEPIRQQRRARFVAWLDQFTNTDIERIPFDEFDPVNPDYKEATSATTAPRPGSKPLRVVRQNEVA